MTFLQSTLREMQAMLARTVSQPRFWIILVVMVVLFSLIGPFGTFDKLPLPQRFAYWALTMVGAWAITIICIAASFALLRAPNAIIPLVVGTLASILPVSLYVQFIKPIFLGEPLPLLTHIAYTAPISFAFGMVTYFTLEKGGSFEQAQEDDSSALLDRLPHAKRGPIMHMSAEDHYVRITTTKGSELLLMRLGDAFALLGENSGGLQVHRSYWVAKEFVVASEREGGRVVLEMRDGARLPVSRTHLDAARQAGIL